MTQLMLILDCQQEHDLKTCCKKQQAGSFEALFALYFAVMWTDSRLFTGDYC